MWVEFTSGGDCTENGFCEPRCITLNQLFLLSKVLPQIMEYFSCLLPVSMVGKLKPILRPVQKLCSRLISRPPGRPQPVFERLLNLFAPKEPDICFMCSMQRVSTVDTMGTKQVITYMLHVLLQRSTLFPTHFDPQRLPNSSCGGDTSMER